MSVALLSTIFLLLTVVMAALVLGLFFRLLEGRARVASIGLFMVWMLYATVLGVKGVIASKSPPGLVFLLLPNVLFLGIFMVRHPGVREFASKVPVQWLIGMQTYRVLVELSLYGLYIHHLVPRLMTFEGGNLDILTGLTAPVVAWLYASRRINDRAVRAWNWFGIALLTNIVLRAFLTSAGILKTEVPNVGLGLFPFTFLPAFLAPLAMYLHVLVLRSLPRNPGGKETTHRVFAVTEPRC